MTVPDIRHRTNIMLKDPQLSRKYYQERTEMEVDNIAEYYGVKKDSSLYYQLKDVYNPDATCIHFDDLNESHKWVLKEEYKRYNIYRCSKCGAIRQVVKK